MLISCYSSWRGHIIFYSNNWSVLLFHTIPSITRGLPWLCCSYLEILSFCIKFQWRWLLKIHGKKKFLGFGYVGFFFKKKKLEKHTETHGSVVWYISTITPFLSVERDGIACYNYVHNLMWTVLLGIRLAFTFSQWRMPPLMFHFMLTME
jgi:hypothetical protein